MPVTVHWAVICQQANEDAWWSAFSMFRTAWGSPDPQDTHIRCLLPRLPKAGIGFPTGAHPKRGESDGHEPKLVGAR